MVLYTELAHCFHITKAKVKKYRPTQPYWCEPNTKSKFQKFNYNYRNSAYRAPLRFITHFLMKTNQEVKKICGQENRWVCLMKDSGVNRFSASPDGLAGKAENRFPCSF